MLAVNRTDGCRVRGPASRHEPGHLGHHSRSRGRGLAVAALLLCTLATAPAGAQKPAYLLIVHPDNRVASLTADEASSLLLKKRTTWDDGVPVEPVDLGASSPTRETLSQGVHGRPVSAVKSYWQSQVFSGTLVPPPEMESDAQVITFVREHRGALGYVGAGAVLEGVRIVPLLVPPQRIEYVAPTYPAAAERMRISGSVKLRLSIGASGSVDNVEVLNGLPMGVTEEAVRAARRWRYRPATLNGEPFASTVEVTLQFGG